MPPCDTVVTVQPTPVFQSIWLAVGRALRAYVVLLITRLAKLADVPG